LRRNEGLKRGLTTRAQGGDVGAEGADPGVGPGKRIEKKIVLKRDARQKGRFGNKRI